MAFIKWDLEVGCARFRENHHKGSIRGNVSSGSLQESGSLGCGGMKMDDVRVLVKGWTWVPDNLENFLTSWLLSYANT